MNATAPIGMIILDTILSDERLEAYQDGHLSPPEEQGLEKRLADDAGARRRLALRAGITMPEASPELRQRILDEFSRHSPPRAPEVATRTAGKAPS